MKRDRKVWLFALGYFVAYTPYAALIKLMTLRGVAGLELLPGVLYGTVAASLVLVTLLGWWKYLRPSTIEHPLALLISGAGTASFVAATTIAYTFRGISIVFALLLMRGGVLVMAPLIDVFFLRRVRWFSWVALALTFVAVAVAFTSIDRRDLSVAAIVNLGAYLVGYFVRLPAMTHCAKVRDRDVTLSYFAREIVIMLTCLLGAPAIYAFVARGSGAAALRRGFALAIPSEAVAVAMAIGLCYAILYIFATLIYLDHRENTFCIPLWIASSLVAGLAAAGSLHAIFHTGAPPPSQIAGALIMIVALLFLSPIHHQIEDMWELVRGHGLKGAALEVSPSRVILFVCSGNTCRSPMAAAIARAEAAMRSGSSVRVESAGIAPRAGAPMTSESHVALGAIGVSVERDHIARALTPRIVAEADVIYAMTREQRDAVVREFPEAAAKTCCLDPNDDVPDPIGKTELVYAETAQRLRELVQMRLDELGLAHAG